MSLARIARTLGKMAPGTLGGDSRVATPVDLRRLRPPRPIPTALPCVNEQWTPVEFEACDQLTGIKLPDGRGMLMWVVSDRTTAGAGNEVHSAFVSRPTAWLANGVVPSADVARAGDGSTVLGCALFTDGVDVYYSLMRHENGEGWQEIYRATDPADPTTWVLHGTVQDDAIGTSDALLNITMCVAGSPLIVGDVWVYTGGIFTSFFGSYFIARCGLWYSDDGGVSWVNKVNQGYYLVGGSYIDFIGGQVGVDPATGFFYWCTAGGPFTNSTIWESTDGGASWVATFTDEVAGWRLTRLSELNGYGYMVHTGNATVYRLVGPGEDPPDMEDTGHEYLSTPVALRPESTKTNHIGDRVHVFSENTVQRACIESWRIVG